MFSTAVQIIPHLSARDLASVAVEAEALGYNALWVSDEGFMTDPFVALGLIADKTKQIELGIVTNPYTRHPAMTAAAIASLDILSSGRAALCFVAGGSLVLDPIQMERVQPLATVREAIAITRALLTGERINWQGTRFNLHDAQLDMPTRTSLPIHVAARGEKMLAMAAREADAVWTGVEMAAAVREAAGVRPVSIVMGETPPLNSEMAGALKAAVEQDSDGESSPPPVTMAQWAASVRDRASVFDQLLIVTWEKTPEAMITMLRAVKEALS